MPQCCRTHLQTGERLSQLSCVSKGKAADMDEVTIDITVM